MESGTPGVKATEDGWLNRSLHSLPQPASADAFRAIAMGPSLPRILSGSEPAVAMNNINDFSVGGNNPEASPNSNTFEAMYDHSVDSVLHGTGQETFDAVKMLRSADPSKYKPARGRRLSQRTLRRQPQAARATDQGESRRGSRLRRHRRLGPSRQRRQHARPARQRACANSPQSLAAFWTDLGDLAEDTVVVTMSEFGRTARENGNRGTDHGHANVMFVMGGPVKGGKVYGRGPASINPTLRRPRLGRHHRFPTGFRRSGVQPPGKQRSESGFPRLRQSARKVLEVLRIKLQLNHHIVAFNSYGINGNVCAGIVLRLAGRRIPAPSVPRANQFVTFDDTLSQRPSTVQAEHYPSRRSSRSHWQCR